MSSDPVIRARGLGKAYPQRQRPALRLAQILRRTSPTDVFWAVRGVDLDIRRGETVGILGRNGSGKSTLLEMISGTLEPSEGELSVGGRVAALLELGAGFNPDFTGRENVHLNATILGLTAEEITARFADIAAFADIGTFIDQPVRTYSSGMYARLAFAVAINVDPEILIVDEILSVGDEAFQRKCFARIDEIRSRGGTVLFVSHAASTVLELCDRALLLDAGEPLLDADPKTVVALYQRLLYAPHDKVAGVREAIRAEGREAGSGIPSLDADATSAAAAMPAERADPAFFDPYLESKSRLVYDTNGARIESPVLFNLDEVPVNCLSTGHHYVFRYETCFLADAFDVRFHSLVKSVSGFELGGGTHPVAGATGPDFAAGQRVVVEFTFDCRLNPGVYFLNCGVTGCGHLQLHRIVDALAFRVIPVEGAVSFGHVSFDFRAVVSQA